LVFSVFLGYHNTFKKAIAKLLNFVLIFNFSEFYI